MTPFSSLSAEHPDVVVIHPGGFLQPKKNGRTLLIVQAGPRTARIPVVVEGFDKLAGLVADTCGWKLDAADNPKTQAARLN